MRAGSILYITVFDHCSKGSFSPNLLISWRSPLCRTDGAVSPCCAAVCDGAVQREPVGEGMN